MPKRLGIMGGTFDPVHFGHLRTAEEACEALELDAVLFVPAFEPPHKPGEDILPYAHRRRMLELAISDNPRFMLSDIEKRLPGKSYTVNSLHKLREEFPEAELFFLVGMDAFLEMDGWFQYRELFRLAGMVVLKRPGYDEEDVGEFLRRRVSDGYSMVSGSETFTHPVLFPVHCLLNTRMDVSSTRIRELAAYGRSIRYLVPREVVSYIDGENLYRRHGEGLTKEEE